MSDQTPSQVYRFMEEQLGTLLEFTNNISVGRSVVHMNGRSGAVADDPHILNVSGDNTLTVGIDWNTGNVAPKSVTTGSPYNAGNTGRILDGGNWNLQSDAGTFTINGGTIFNTNNVAINLRLMGAGNGVINAPLGKYAANPTMAVTKMGGGTWTLTNANNVESGNTHAFDGNVTVQGGTLALSGAGSLANSPSIEIKNGAFLDVSGVFGGVYNLNSFNTVVKGTGTIVGSLAASTGNTIAPGETGTGTLHVAGALSLNSAATQFEFRAIARC